MLSSFRPDDRLVLPQGSQEDSATEPQKDSLKRLVNRITTDANQFSALRCVRVCPAAYACQLTHCVCLAADVGVR